MAKLDMPITREFVDNTKDFTTAIFKAAEAIGVLIDQNEKLIQANAKIAKSDDTAKNKKKQLTEVEKEAERIRKAQLKTHAQLNKAKSDEAIRLAKTRLELQKTNKEIKLDIQLKKAQKGSIDQLIAVNAVMEQRLRKVNLTTEEGRKKAQTYQNVINKNTQKIKDNSSVRGKQILSIGGYTEGIKSAISETGVFSTQQEQLAKIQRLITALTFKQAGAQGAATAATTLGSKAMKIFKIALASTGIGLLVVALGSLVTFFKSTEEGAAALQKIMSPLNILFGNISDIAGNIGKRLVDAFNNPKKAAIDLWNVIKTNIVNRFLGVIDLFKGFGTVIKGALELDTTKIKEGAKQAGNAFIQTMTGVEDAVGKAKAAIGRFIDETARENEQNKKLIESRLSLIKRERSAALELAELNVKIANDRIKIGDEENLTDTERLNIADKTLESIVRKGEIETELAKERLRQKELENTFSASSKDDLDEENQLRVALINTESNAAKESLRIANRRQSIIKKIKSDELALNKQLNDDLEKSEAETDKEILDGKKELDAELNKLNKSNADFAIKQAKREADERIAIQKSIRDAAINLTAQGAQAITDILLESSSQRRDAELERIDEQREEDLGRIEEQANEDLVNEDAKVEAGIQTEEQAAERKKRITENLEAEQTRIEEEADRKAAVLKTKQAKAEKAAALANIAINTAVAVTKATAQGLIPLIPFIVASGAIQAATVLATPIPKFFKGTSSAPDGALIAGDHPTKGGASELIIPKNSEPFLTPDKPTLYKGLKGAEIVPSHKVKERLSKMSTIDKRSEMYNDSGIRGDVRKLTKVLKQQPRIIQNEGSTTTQWGGMQKTKHQSFLKSKGR